MLYKIYVLKQEKLEKYDNTVAVIFIVGRPRPAASSPCLKELSKMAGNVSIRP